MSKMELLGALEAEKLTKKSENNIAGHPVNCLPTEKNILSTPTSLIIFFQSPPKKRKKRKKIITSLPKKFLKKIFRPLQMFTLPHPSQKVPPSPFCTRRWTYSVLLTRSSPLFLPWMTFKFFSNPSEHT